MEKGGWQDGDVTKVCSVPMPPLHSNPVVGSVGELRRLGTKTGQAPGKYHESRAYDN